MLYFPINNLSIILVTTTIVFYIGLIGMSLNRHNILKVLMSLELVMLSVNLNLIFFSVYLDDLAGQVFVMFVLALSAAESAVGLAILSRFYQIHHGVKLSAVKIKSKNLKV